MALEAQILMNGLMFGESPRWHENRLWFSDWGAQELIAVDLTGNSEVILKVASFPFSIDWLADGRLLIVSASDPAAASPGTRRVARNPCRPVRPIGLPLERDRRGRSWQCVCQQHRV
jgi:sugar lactone lactonase YvrE